MINNLAVHFGTLDEFNYIRIICNNRLYHYPFNDYPTIMNVYEIDTSSIYRTIIGIGIPATTNKKECTCQNCLDNLMIKSIIE
jgi:hypothetical protein